MFYSAPAESIPGATSAIVALTPSESKRLIAKAVAAMPEVRRAQREGRVIIARGTTTAYVAEELLGREVPKADYAAGIITQGQLCMTAVGQKPFTLVRGRETDQPPSELLEEFEGQDVFIKSANAVDPQGNAGIIMLDPKGGTIGSALPYLAARGSHLVVPVGLEKLVPSVPEAAKSCGIYRWKHTTGYPVGFMPLVNTLVVTEREAIRLLCSVRATHVASGGAGGSEGSVVLALEGPEAAVDEAFALVQSIKGEPAVPQPKAVTSGWPEGHPLAR